MIVSMLHIAQEIQKSRCRDAVDLRAAAKRKAEIRRIFRDHVSGLAGESSSDYHIRVLYHGLIAIFGFYQLKSGLSVTKDDIHLLARGAMGIPEVSYTPGGICRHTVISSMLISGRLNDITKLNRVIVCVQP